MDEIDTPALSDRPRPMIQMWHVRRGAHLLGAVLDDEGRPVVSVCCDCATQTDLVVDAKTAPNGTYEMAFTCDGCRTSHWMTFTIDREATDG